MRSLVSAPNCDSWPSSCGEGSISREIGCRKAYVNRYLNILNIAWKSFVVLQGQCTGNCFYNVLDCLTAFFCYYFDCYSGHVDAAAAAQLFFLFWINIFKIFCSGSRRIACPLLRSWTAWERARELPAQVQELPLAVAGYFLFFCIGSRIAWNCSKQNMSFCEHYFNSILYHDHA